MVIALSVVFYTLKLGIGPVPTSPAVRRGVFELLNTPEMPQQPHCVTELGCGWGGMLLWLARRYPEARITGYEYSFWPWLITWLRIRFNRLSHRVVVQRRNFMQEPLPRAELM